MKQLNITHKQTAEWLKVCPISGSFLMYFKDIIKLTEKKRKSEGLGVMTPISLDYLPKGKLFLIFGKSH